MYLLQNYMWFIIPMVLGFLTYEAIFARRTKKYERYLEQKEAGTLPANLRFEPREPVRARGLIYVLIGLGIGSIYITAFLALAFGACMMLIFI